METADARASDVIGRAASLPINSCPSSPHQVETHGHCADSETSGSGHPCVHYSGFVSAETSNFVNMKKGRFPCQLFVDSSLGPDIPIWDSNKKMTCKEMDYFSECTFPKVCGKRGCYDCPSGNHLCERDRGYYFTSCPDGKKCHSSGCIDGEDPDNPRLCLTNSPEDDPVVRLPPLRLLCRGP